MELSVYDIIKRIIVTEKSADLFKQFGKITFEVHRDSNKIMIRQAVEKIWNVKIKSVHVINCPGKNKLFGRKSFTSPDRKKAIVSLKEGYKIELPGHFETMGAADSANEKMPAIEGK
jgi:large subunit ribosomal protein L23